MHTRMGTHTHMGEPRNARDTCMGSPYVYGLRKMAHTRMGQPIRVRENTCMGQNIHIKLLESCTHVIKGFVLYQRIMKGRHCKYYSCFDYTGNTPNEL